MVTASTSAAHASCCVCGSAVAGFVPDDAGTPAGARCPACGSSATDRFLGYLIRQLRTYLASSGGVLGIGVPAPVRSLLDELAGSTPVTVASPAGGGDDVRANLTRLPFPDETFDVIASYRAHERMPDGGSALREVARVLQPGGIVFIQDHPTWRDGSSQLSAAGLMPSRMHPPDLLGPGAMARLGLAASDGLWVCRRPGRARRHPEARVRQAAHDGPVDLPHRSEADLLWDEVHRLRNAAARLRKTLWDRDRELARQGHELERAHQRVDEMRRSMARIKGRPPVRAAMAMMTVARRVAETARRANEARTPCRAPDAPDDDVLPDEPGQFRRQLRQRLGPDGALSVAIVGGPPELLDLQDRPGWRVVAAGGSAAPDDCHVVLLVDPDADGHAVDRSAIVVGFVRDAPDAWREQSWFDDLDVLIAADGACATRLAEGGAPAPAVLPGGALTATALATILLRWCDAIRVSISTPTPSRELADRWGDTFFARAMQGELERAGHATRVYLRDEFDEGHLGRADVGLHLLGLAVPEIRTGQVNVLWIISHPERVTAELCNGYDLVVTASEPYAATLQPLVGVPVLPLLQATDHRRFRPDPTGPEHDVIFVANSRWTRRHIIDDLTPTDLDVAVYGREWSDDLIDARHVRGEGIPNAELARYYSSARVVLNDHWPEMAADGFVSNRVYDALACGAVVVSDPVVGMDEQFDGAVVTYDGRRDLHAAITRLLGDDEERRRRGERGRRAVLERHTFAARVERLMAVVQPLLDRAATAEPEGVPSPR